MTPEEVAEMQEKLKNMSPEELKDYQKQNCVFCQIISGKIPAKKVYEDDKLIGVLDINPASKGHVLLMPKEHYHIMPIVPKDVLGNLFKAAKKIASAAIKGLKAKGSDIFVANGGAAGQRAQHFMIHVIPRYEYEEIKQLEIPEKKISEEDIKKIKERLGIKNVEMKKKVEVIKDKKSEPDHIQKKEEAKKYEKKQDKSEKDEKKVEKKQPETKDKKNDKGLKELSKEEKAIDKIDKSKKLDLDEIARLLS
jgi:histidine triad (HIT) family protein